jgi:hypothetical protein
LPRFPQGGEREKLSNDKRCDADRILSGLADV